MIRNFKAFGLGLVAVLVAACGRPVLPSLTPAPYSPTLVAPQVRQASGQSALMGVVAEVRRLLERQFAKDPDLQFIDRVNVQLAQGQGQYTFDCRFTDNAAMPRRTWKLSGTFDAVRRTVQVTHQEPIPDPILP